MKRTISYFLFKKQFGRLRMYPLLRLIPKSIACLMALYVPIAMSAFVSDLRTNTDQYAAVLLSAHAFSNHDHWAPPLAFLGSYPAWTFYFNSRGLKTDYIFSATKQDFLDVLGDDKYQSIVLVGHGSYNLWRATDDEIANDDIEQMQGAFKKKRGEWFQLSCASEDYSPIQLGELVMAHGKSYCYNGDTGMLYFVIDALTAFRLIKGQTEKRLISL